MKLWKILLIMPFLLSASQASAETFIVTSDQPLGPGTLYEAIAASNTTTGVQTIIFNVPNDNTITAAAGLPNITDPVIIDGHKKQVIATGGGLSILNLMANRLLKNLCQGQETAV
jgi:hypothetical protein